MIYGLQILLFLLLFAAAMGGMGLWPKGAALPWSIVAGLSLYIVALLVIIIHRTR